MKSHSLLQVIAAILFTMVASGGVKADLIVINSAAFGEKSREVPGLEFMTQAEVAHEAVKFALDPSGWNLADIGGYAQEFGAPMFSGGTEWVLRAPDSTSASFGFNVYGWDAPWNERVLIFHTDDTISRSSHDLGEPAPFGTISGLRPGVYPHWLEVAVQDWGTYSVGVVPEPTTLIIWLGLSGIGLLAAHRRRKRNV